MKKGQIISLALGSAAVVAGAVFYTAAKIAGVKTPSKHDAHDELVNTPYKPEEEPDYEQEEFAEEQVDEEAPAEEITEDTDEYADEYAAEYAENSPSDEETSEAEEKEPENLEEYIEKNLPVNSDESEEEKYFTRYAKINALLKGKFMNLDPLFSDHIVEDIYHYLYESED